MRSFNFEPDTFMKIILRILISLVVLLVLFVAGVIVFTNTAPQFGKAPEGEDLERIRKSDNYDQDQFQNLIETRMDMNFWKGLKLIPEMLDGADREPKSPLPTRFEEKNSLSVDSLVYLTWFGHSAMLMEIEGRKLLLDPMLGPASSPVRFFTRRFGYQQSIDLESIGYVDAVLISHDHYDHLDYYTVTRIREKVGHFYTALGVGSHLRHWGVPESKITELDWWQETDHQGLRIACTPSRHFSGRGFSDRNKTQWASWVIQSDSASVYFSGDTGYGPHFRDIGDMYGPFDFAMLECGQYNQQWAAIHMMPEQTVQASVDLRSKKMMPIHWGGFNLSLHTWTDPIERSTLEAERKGVDIVHPYIGQRFEINDSPTEKWWESVD